MEGTFAVRYHRSLLLDSKKQRLSLLLKKSITNSSEIRFTSSNRSLSRLRKSFKRKKTSSTRLTWRRKTQLESVSNWS